ncbi:MAG: right-handed parallel beta-helix repeat-containing protein, partial [Promethearchaeota archaeon]
MKITLHGRSINTWQLFLLTYIFFLGIVAIQSTAQSPPALTGRVNSSESLAPFALNNGTDLDAFPNKTGSGNSTDPYIIENFEIDAGGAGYCIFINNSDRYLIIRNCTLTGAQGTDEAGIFLINCTNVIIENCTSTQNFHGIINHISENCTIANSSLYNNIEYGTVVSSSNNITILHNDFSGNGESGIGMTFSNRSRVEDNNAFNNGAHGLVLSFSNDNIIELNNMTINNYTGISIQDSANNLLDMNNLSSNQVEGIQINDSINVTVIRNFVFNNSAQNGIMIATSNFCNISLNDISHNNLSGVAIFNSDDNTIRGNEIYGNDYGVYVSAPNFLAGSDRNNITENTLENSAVNALFLEFGIDNNIYLNNFVNTNGFQALVTLWTMNNNNWNNSMYGNYWSDYANQHPAVENDGIVWDEPYHINDDSLFLTGSDDYFPLVNPVKPNFHAPTLSSPDATPLVGTPSTPIQFTVNYTDQDDNRPFTINVAVNGTIYALDKQSAGDNDFTDGCIYVIVLYLQPGTYEYQFECTDSRFNDSTGTIPGISITGGNTSPPTLTPTSVLPGHGFNDTTEFKFSVTYTDVDNNAPEFINVTLNTTTNVTTTFEMVKLDAGDTNYMDGADYVLSTRISIVGNYTYWFVASDGTNNVSSSTFSGLEVDESYVLYPDGMQYDWFGWIRLAASPSNMSGTESYHDGGGDLVNVIGSLSNRDINGTTREILNDGGGFLAVGSHEPVRLYTDLYLGSEVPISIYLHRAGDELFTVTGETELSMYGRVFLAWVLESKEGSVAFYDQYSGLLLNGTFLSYPATGVVEYSLQMNGTNVGLAPMAAVPSLTSGTVTPSGGSQNQLFNFTVLYMDADNNAPYSINVSINGTEFTMEKINGSDLNYLDGCEYTLTTYLQPGTYSFFFEATDGFNPVNTITFTGLDVTESNTASPVLSNAQVAPPVGYNGTTIFLISVSYSDADNNAPKYVNATINGSQYTMEKQDALDNNYIDGCTYELAIILNQTGMIYYSIGTSDGIHTDSISPAVGIEVREYYPLATDGLVFNYTAFFNNQTQNIQLYTDIFNDIGGELIHVNSTRNNRTFDASTRIITDDEGGDLLNGSHEPMRIFTNIGIGSDVSISVAFSGDQEFTVMRIEQLFVANRSFECWVLESPEGSIAYYETYSGLLINGTFFYRLFGIHFYCSIQYAGANFTLSPNTQAPSLEDVTVSHPTIYPNINFTINVTYYDADNNASE